MAESKKYKVLCWGDCKKFPEIGKCNLDWTNKAGQAQHAVEGDVRDDLIASDIHWLLRDGFIEQAQEGE